jgi:hypothetical protein
MRIVCTLAIVLAGCGTDHRPDYWLDQDPSLGGAQAIFNRNCLIGCHSGNMPAGNLSLEAEVSREQLVDVGTAAYCDIDGIRVVPGDPENSCLWILIESDTMPLEANPLQPFQKDKIYRWILDGAPE